MAYATNAGGVHWTTNLPVPIPPSDIIKLPTGSVGASLWVILGGLLWEVLKDPEVQAWLKKTGTTVGKALAKKAASVAGRAFRWVVLKVAERWERGKLPPPTEDDPRPTSGLFEIIRRNLEILREAQKEPVLIPSEAELPQREEKGGIGAGGILIGVGVGVGLILAIKAVRG